MRREEFTDVRYEVERGLAWITIDRPERYNAFRARTIDELIFAFKSAWADRGERRGRLARPKQQQGLERERRERRVAAEESGDEQQPLRPGARAAPGGGRHGRTTVPARASSSTVIP
mgnify:CR=1 FL=1